MSIILKKNKLSGTSKAKPKDNNVIVLLMFAYILTTELIAYIVLRFKLATVKGRVLS